STFPLLWPGSCDIGRPYISASAGRTEGIHGHVGRALEREADRLLPGLHDPGADAALARPPGALEEHAVRVGLQGAQLAPLPLAGRALDRDLTGGAIGCPAPHPDAPLARAKRNEREPERLERQRLRRVASDP